MYSEQSAPSKLYPLRGHVLVNVENRASFHHYSAWYSSSNAAGTPRGAASPH